MTRQQTPQPMQTTHVVEPDVGKRGVQPEGPLKPYPPKKEPVVASSMANSSRKGV